MILITALFFIIAGAFITHFVLVQDYYDLRDVVLTYLTSLIIFGLFGLCVGYVVDFLWSFLKL